ncbi:hypothetical protein [Gehongia tenuis]|uniref:Uncharacterized protein n=1 Tax=Gehongia tenuis TaxID=2763655 RepID=A0A926HPC6_9FIRM|nr:hypothetical protein [Gehongia tenuis]MBC8530555.1 hypothetical protein [Gehongia tenuis]
MMLFCNHDPVSDDFSRDLRCFRCGEEVCDFLYDLEGAWLCEDCFDLICLEFKRRARYDAFDLAEALREPLRDIERRTGDGVAAAEMGAPGNGVSAQAGDDASGDGVSVRAEGAVGQRPGEDPGGAAQ